MVARRSAWLLDPETIPNSGTLANSDPGGNSNFPARSKLDHNSRTRAASLPTRSKMKRSKFDALEISMDGLEVCRSLRQDFIARKLPIIILSTRASELDRILGLEAGADDYVIKPFSPQELRARIMRLLK